MIRLKRPHKLYWNIIKLKWILIGLVAAKLFGDNTGERLLPEMVPVRVNVPLEYSLSLSHIADKTMIQNNLNCFSKTILVDLSLDYIIRCYQLEVKSLICCIDPYRSWLIRQLYDYPSVTELIFKDVVNNWLLPYQNNENCVYRCVAFRHWMINSVTVNISLH